MTVKRAAPIALLLAGLLTWAACEDSSPPAGEGCRASGGTCSSAACGASLPYPCPTGEACCQPPPSSGRDAGTE